MTVPTNSSDRTAASNNPGRPLTVVREPCLAEDIVIVDGLPGCGKTLMTAVVSGLDRVELMQYSYQIEYACALAYLGKIEPDAARSLIRMFSDLQLYNVMMSRDTNFRWSDLSGVLSNPNWLKYIRRLFQPGDAAVIGKLERERPILHLVTHQLFGVSPILFSALGERLKFIEVVRHPLYMLKQQFLYMHRWATDVRDFTIWIQHEGRALPWFARGWEEKYAQSNSMDQAIYMIEEMWALRRRSLDQLDESCRVRFLTIPFERFVVEPWPYMSRLETLLGTRVTDLTRRVMKKQKVPRKMYAEGISLPIYKEYGWEPPRSGSDEAKEFAKRRQYVAEHASQGGLAILDQLCSDYEREHMSKDSLRHTS